MSIKIRQAGNYPLLKNELIFLEGQPAQSLNLLLKGQVDVYLCSNDEEEFQAEEHKIKNSYRLFTVDRNIFIGTAGQFLDGKHCFSFRTTEDANLYVFPATNREHIMALLHSQKEYYAYTLTSMATLMDQSYHALLKLEEWMNKLSILADNLSVYFWSIKDQYNLTHMPSFQDLIDSRSTYQTRKQLGQIPMQFTPECLDQELPGLTDSNYHSVDHLTMDKIQYYQHILDLPLELRKDFFSSDDYLATYHFKDVALTTSSIRTCTKQVMRRIEENFKRIYTKGDRCIFAEYIYLLTELRKFNQNSESLVFLLDLFIQKITNVALTFQDEFHYDLQLDLQQMLHVSSGLAGQIEKTPRDENIPDDLIDSCEKIIRYSGINNESADLFRTNLNAFRLLKNNSTPDDLRKITSTLTPIFFEIYELIFKKVVSENNESRLLKMFLNYGYMDERILSIEQVHTLYDLVDQSYDTSPCAVHNGQEWLRQIHALKKDPSINEFDQDYFDIFREMKKRSQITDSDKLFYDRDASTRLHFEIINLFRINQKLNYGHANSYFPILHSGMISRDLNQAFVTKDSVNEIIDRILEVDFSAFHREIFYKDSQKGFEKEIISKAIFPDIILMPTYGSRGNMWQEITGRVRSTPGRIILPIFTSENLEDLLIKMVGNFRWELCRTMMGNSWNDITEKSLTSEYTDYIQFYKKNKDLSEDAKEKLKIQIQRFSNIRDIFTTDYMTWIKYERNGNIRLNKVARSILYKYCPFAKPIREKLEKQPNFNELAIPFNTLRNKQARELESRYNRLLNNNISSDEELEKNLKFYKEN